MLDQPILSFKNMNAAGSPGEAASTHNSGGGELASSSSEIDQTEATSTNHKFSDVLKKTQSQMSHSEASVEDAATALSANEFITIESLEPIDIEASALTMSGIDQQVLGHSFNLNSETDVEISLVDEGVNGVVLPETTGLLVSTTLEPLDMNAEGFNLAPLTVAQAPETTKPLLQPVNPLADPEAALATPKVASATIELPMQGGGVSIKAQLLQQLDKVVAETLIEGEEPNMDVDILKTLGFSAQTPMSTQASLNSPTQSPLTVTIPFQQANWGSAVAEKVMWLNNHGLQEAEIQLDPPELGPLQVKISIDNDQAHVSFVVQHSNVKEALEQTSARLREMFDAEGIDLVDVDVSDQSEQQDDAEDLADSSPDDAELVDKQTEQQGDAMRTSYIPSDNGIDAYV